jgi:hypothetical protein
MSELSTPEQRALAQYMSELSEEAYCAHWMADLEYNLWEAVVGLRREFGRTTISHAKKQKLRELGDDCAGWIVFENDVGETWLPLEAWQQRFKAWQLDKSSQARRG